MVGEGRGSESAEGCLSCRTLRAGNRASPRVPKDFIAWRAAILSFSASVTQSHELSGEGVIQSVRE